jgi:manganese transport protein
VFTVGACLAVETWLVEPATRSLASVLSPRLDAASLYVAVAMLGATVMPHNLYLHSSLVQTRAMPTTDEAQRRALRYNFVDTLIALNVAFVINASILVLAADVFHANGIVVTDLREAQRLLSPLLGTSLAGILFAVALLAAGQSSTITGTLAAQIVMQGFLGLRGSPMTVRMITRGVAMLPAVLVLALLGDDSTVTLLIATQVVLSLQLPFALVPLIRFTSSRHIMGTRASSAVVRALAAFAALLVIGSNAWLVVQTLGAQRGAIMSIMLAALLVAAVALLVYLALAPLRMGNRAFEELPEETLARQANSPATRPL